jgi:2-amino-4-hydroxy-6-hydroxymethyldihydropteridine diphosphokinase
MPEVFLGIGSNLRPESSLRAARDALVAQFGAVRWSAVYRSAAEGAAAADYANAAAAFTTELAPIELRRALRAIEEACDRTRADATVVALDIDLLFYGQRVDPAERLPRPRAFVAPYVVVPLAELEPALVHPVLGTTAAAAVRAVDPAAVERDTRFFDFG